MTIRKQEYNQLVNGAGEELVDKYFYGMLKRLWFKVNKIYKIPIYEGYASWRNRSYTATFGSSSYTLIPFDVQETKSQLINIKKSADHKFRVSKTGWYLINVNWESGITNLTVVYPSTTRLAVAKNGATSGDDFVILDGKELCSPIVGVATGDILKGLSCLQGTKALYLKKDTDYIEFYFAHWSRTDLGAETTHFGFVDIHYLGKNARDIL